MIVRWLGALTTFLQKLFTSGTVNRCNSRLGVGGHFKRTVGAENASRRPGFGRSSLLQLAHLLEDVQILNIACRPCIRREFCTKDV
jgi:hypothetical protein